MHQTRPAFSLRPLRGFTLIELLVVVAVIAILIGVLLPALGQARASAQQAKGAAIQKQLVVGMESFGVQNDGAIPGINTSGRASYEQLAVQDPSGADNLLNERSDLPVQSWDWMTPALEADDLPVNRAERFRQILTVYADPALGVDEAVLNATDSDMQDVVDRSGPYPAPSYLMPASFQLYPEQVDSPEPDEPALQYGWPAAESAVELASGYVPRTDRVGPTSRKVAIADGTRGYDDSSGEWRLYNDAWADPTESLPEAYGAFVSQPPPIAASRAYPGVTTQGAQEPSWHETARAASFRHGGQMNAAFFDGHVEALEQDEALDPNIWYPSGSEIVSFGELNARAQILWPDQQRPRID